MVAVCGSFGEETETSTAPNAAGGSDAQLPVTIEHAFGETTVQETPERVVTWGWGSTDAALARALGVVPVTIPLASHGGSEDGVLPWVAEAPAERGAETPELIPDTDGIPFELIDAQDPRPHPGRLLRHHHRGLRDLSAIAPTVAYPDQAWSTPWRDVVLTVGEAMGMPEEFLTEPYAATLPQVQEGAVASIVGQDVVASVSPPTALSLTYGLDTYVEELSQAVENAG